MSRNISFFSLFILLAWLICGCQPQPAVSVSESSLSFSSDGGNKVVTVTANYEWTASSSDSWIRVKTTKDSNELTITVSSSTDTDARQGKVTITCKEVSATINISQSQRDCINLKETALVKLDADAHDVEVKLEANVNFNALVTVGAEWITVKSTKAMTTSTVTLGIAANTTRRTRTGTVTFSATSSDTKQALTIQQLGLAQTLAFVVNGVSTFQVPLITSPTGSSAFTGYLWVGSDKSEYVKGAQITLDPSAKTNIKIEGNNMNIVSFDNVLGLSKIDLTEL